MRKDTEVHSGYYTEAVSVCQPEVPKRMDMIDTTRADAGDEPRMRADARRSRMKLLEAATTAFAENGADAPLEDIARRAGVGIGTLYRHFPTRTDLQAAVFRIQVDAVCSTADDLMGTVSPEQAFVGSVRAIAGYLITKRGLSKALVDTLGRDSELISVCSTRMRETLDQLLGNAQQAGFLRPDVSAKDVLRLMHGIVMATETTPEDTDRLLGVMLDGLRAQNAGRAQPSPG
jgi:AcrR family transcriptional regulator